LILTVPGYSLEVGHFVNLIGFETSKSYRPVDPKPASARSVRRVFSDGIS